MPLSAACRAKGRCAACTGGARVNRKHVKCDHECHKKAKPFCERCGRFLKDKLCDYHGDDVVDVEWRRKMGLWS
jgi:hypothetical protein